MNRLTRGDSNGFQPRNPDVDFHGQQRTNETPASRTDPEARLYRKGRGKESKLAHMGHAIAENRHGLVVSVTVTVSAMLTTASGDFQWSAQWSQAASMCVSGPDSGPS